MTWNERVADKPSTRPINLNIEKLMGGRTASECASAAGVALTNFCGLLRLTQSPFSRRDEADERTFTQTAKKIARYFCMLPEDLFPYGLYAAQMPFETARRYPAPEVVPLAAAGRERAPFGNPEDCAEAEEVHTAVRYLLRTLSPREERVINMRFGFEDGHQYTFAEIASSFGVSPELIRKIQVLAMRKLRHPSRTRPMLNFIS